MNQSVITVLKFGEKPAAIHTYNSYNTLLALFNLANGQKITKVPNLNHCQINYVYGM